MLKRIFLLSALIIIISSFAEAGGFGNYTFKIEKIIIEDFPGLHSFAHAEYEGKCLIIGGRRDGLHARQPFASFPEAANNNEIFIIDLKHQKLLFKLSLDTFPIELREQLSSSNMQHYLDGDWLYLTGGYGYSKTAADHITYDKLIAINLPSFFKSVESNEGIQNSVRFISDSMFAVTGGQMGKLDSIFYLVGGHNFVGRYNPMNHNTFKQEYTNQARRFIILHEGNDIQINKLEPFTDPVLLRRRDYNLLPQMNFAGDIFYTAFSGVFQNNRDLPYLNTVDISNKGLAANNSFNQYLCNYHCPAVCVFDSSARSMHTFFFGGISQFYIKDGNIIQDNNVPFVNTVSRVTRFEDGSMEEVFFDSKLPEYIGSSAAFVINDSLPHNSKDIIFIRRLNGTPILLGYIIGGIMSPETNPFTVNNTGVTKANSTIYKVWLTPNHSTGHEEILDGSNKIAFDIILKAGALIRLNVKVPEDGYLDIYIVNLEGKMITNETEFVYTNRKNEIELRGGQPKLPAGTYFATCVINGKYSFTKKFIID